MCFANGMAVNAAINGVMIVFGGALLLAFCLVALGLALSRSKKPNTRILGANLGLVGCGIQFVCCLSFVNFNDRSGLRQRIEAGMTEAEVLQILGQPDSKSAGMCTTMLDRPSLSISVCRSAKTVLWMAHTSSEKLVACWNRARIGC